MQWQVNDLLPVYLTPAVAAVATARHVALLALPGSHAQASFVALHLVRSPQPTLAILGALKWWALAPGLVFDMLRNSRPESLIGVFSRPRREHPVDWNAPKHALALREPRRGCRAALAATVHTPEGPLLVYNLHLEVRIV